MEIIEPSGVSANGDAQVDVDDLLDVLGSFGPCPCCPSDFDGNGIVSVDEVLTSSLAGLAENGQAFNRISTSCKCELVLVTGEYRCFWIEDSGFNLELRINRNWMDRILKLNLN